MWHYQRGSAAGSARQDFAKSESHQACFGRPETQRQDTIVLGWPLMPCRSCKAVGDDVARMYCKAAHSRSVLSLPDTDGKLSASDCVVAAREEAVAQLLVPPCYYHRRDLWRTRAMLGRKVCASRRSVLWDSLYSDRAEVQGSETNHISTFQNFAPRVIRVRR